MTRQELIALINQEIDGTNSAAETADLQLETGRNIEARKLMEELKGLTLALESTRTLSCPPSLKHAVMREVRHRNEIQLKAASPLRTPWLSRFFRKPSFTFVSGLAIGVALVILYFNFTPPRSIEPRDASGTILWAPSTLQAGQTLDFAQFGLQGRLETRYAANMGTLRMEFGSAGIKADFHYPATEMALDGMVRSPDFQGDVVLREGTIIAEGGRGSLTMVFVSKNTADSRIQVTVSAAGNALYEGSIALNPEGGN